MVAELLVESDVSVVLFAYNPLSVVTPPIICSSIVLVKLLDIVSACADIVPAAIFNNVV